MRKTLRDQLQEAQLELADGPFIAMTSTDAELDGPYDDIEDEGWTAWTEQNVYFPATNGRGGEWVGTAPRHPCDTKTGPHGGY